MNDLEQVGISDLQKVLLELLARGHSPISIARELHYSIGYVYRELRDLRQVLGTQTNTGAVVWAVNVGRVALPSLSEMVTYVE